MTDTPDKPVQKKDSLTNLGRSEPRDSMEGDFYSWEEYVYLQKVRIENDQKLNKALDELENRSQKEYGTSKHFLATRKYLEKNNFIGSSSITEMKMEIINAIEHDKKDGSS